MKTKICLLLVLVLIATSSHAETNAVDSGVPVATDISITPTNLAQLLDLPPEQLGKMDIAVIDLLCAEGLRGSEDLNVKQCLKTLDDLAQHVKAETERNHYRFVENPARFKNSEGYFRMMYLVTVLQQDFGVEYNPAHTNDFVEGNGKIVRNHAEDYIYADSKDHFIHGLLTGKHYGTCASMPMLYVAIAQRLGYPVHLATTQLHAYVRYEEGTNHFNVEATCPGFKTYPDAFYKNWPFPITDEYARGAHHLEPLDNKMVLAHCLFARASCLTSMKQYDEAAQAEDEAKRYFPDTPVTRRFFEIAKNDRDKSQWFSWWDEVDRLEVPEGPRFSYFQNVKLRVHMFMNYSYDMDAIGKVVANLKNDVAEYKNEMQFPDSRRDGRLQIWPENLKDLPDFPADTVAMPSLAASPDYWRAIPPEMIQRMQQQHTDSAEDALAEAVRLSNQASESDFESQANANLPPQVQAILQMERQAAQPVPPASQLPMSPQLVETFTKLADNEAFVRVLARYHAEKLQQLEAQTDSPGNNSLPRMPGLPTLNVQGLPPNVGLPGAGGMPGFSGNDAAPLGLPPQVQQALAMANGGKPDPGLDSLRQLGRMQEMFYHMQSLTALSTKGLPTPAKVIHAP